ncbi:MAG: tRNA 4-thiouridine(8) synthase ThiI, partial [Candidatus Binatia bacterium]
RRTRRRIAEAIAKKQRGSALVTGESLAQVASQTLENLAVIEKATTLPILRPLVGMDKQEIIDQARRIGTFETSTIPDQDCCQLFVPRHPATKAKLPDVERAESMLDLKALTQLGAEGAEMEEFKFPD